MATLSGDKTYVTVTRGDTLSQIAADYSSYTGGKTYKQLAAINGISNPDLIYIGQIIKFGTSGEPSSTSNDAQKVTIKQFGLQADIDNVLFVTWTWDKANQTEEYEVRWDYFTNNLWFGGVSSTSTTKDKFSTYSIPSNAKQVRVRVKPISKTKKDGDKEISYWTASWSEWKKHTVSNPPDTPPVPSIDLEGYKLTASVSNLTGDPSLIQFEVVKDNATVCNTGKAKVETSASSYSCTITAGSKYKVRCRAYKDSLYSEWSNYSEPVNTIPAAPSKFTECKAASEKSISLKWDGVDGATGYSIQYSTKETNFDNADQEVTTLSIEDGRTNYEVTGLESGQKYFFRVNAKNEKGSSGWSEISSIVIGTGPAAPTTWSSTTTAISGEPLNLYWVHNTEDGSSQTFAELELTVGDNEPFSEIIENSTNEAEKDKTSVYSVKMVKDDGTPMYVEGTVIRWRVRTAGITNVYGEWSIQRTVYIYAQPTLDLSVKDKDDAAFTVLSSFPFNVSAIASPATQAPIGYHLSIVANEIYETVDNVGNEKSVNVGESLYSKYFNNTGHLKVEISAGDVNLENGVSYTIECIVTMNSGLTAESKFEFEVSWAKTEYSPEAEIGIDDETYSAYIKPFCATYSTTYYEVSTAYGVYYRTNTELDPATIFDSKIVEKAYVTSGDRTLEVLSGTDVNDKPILYCIDTVATQVDNVWLSVYRREFDGSFTELITGLDGSMNTFITDPHPSLDYARYRVVAISKDTGAVCYSDIPGYPVNCKSAVIQWDEAWSNFDTFGNEDALEQPAWSGSLITLSYNIDVTNKNSSDVELVEYIGRKHPVSYYGTQLGESATWNIVIDKKDKETLYALRRLSVWTGDVYVREPSGSGYWASVKVSFSQKHLDVTIPVTIDVTRVEGGV